MNPSHYLKDLRAGKGLRCACGDQSYDLFAVSALKGMEETAPDEVWAFDNFMVEGYTGNLSDTALQMMELAADECRFEFEAWNARMLPTLPSNQNLLVRLVNDDALAQLIERLRMPLAVFRATESKGEMIVASIQANVPEAKKNMRFSKDGSFKMTSISQ